MIPENEHTSRYLYESTIEVKVRHSSSPEKLRMGEIKKYVQSLQNVLLEPVTKRQTGFSSGSQKWRGKLDRYQENALPTKDIYLYPLHKQCRYVLQGSERVY